VPSWCGIARRVDLSIDAIDGLSLVPSVDAKQRRRSCLQSTAQWGTENSNARRSLHSSASGAEGQWFPVSRIKQGVACWVRCSPRSYGSPLVCLAGAGVVARQRDGNSRQERSQRLGFVGHRQRPSPTLARKLARQEGEPEAKLVRESTLQHAARLAIKGDAGAACRRSHGCGWI